MHSTINQSGNALITLIFAVIIATVIYFLIVPEAKRKLEAEEKEKLPSPLAQNLGEANNRPLPEKEKDNYSGVLSWTNMDDITINPFENSSKQQEDAENSKKEIKEKKHKIQEPNNLITSTPLGLPFPKKSDYIIGYPINHTNGTLTTSIDNSKGDSDLMVVLNHHNKINQSFSEESKISRAFFVKKGDKFDVVSLDSGAYSMRWIRLKDGAQAPTQPFLLYKDVKFQYNRVLKFN